jgi:hypothetical protein
MATFKANCDLPIHRRFDTCKPNQSRFMKTSTPLRICLSASAALAFGACADTHVDHTAHYWDRRPQGATSGPGMRNPSTPGSGLTDAGVNTGSGESGNPIH